MASNTENIENLLPISILSVETQAVLIAGFCCVGAWVVLSWMIQLIFSILWPFFIIAAVMVFMPTWRRSLAIDIFPKHIQVLREWGQKYSPVFNSTSVFRST